MSDLFDAAAMYDDDYLHFFATPVSTAATHLPDTGDGRSSTDTDLIWRLLDLRPGMTVLDLGCGHGRIANRLAARGCIVTGLDFSPVFLDRARADAEALGVEVDYVHGDMRDLPWTGRFDRALSWSTAFGYFDDPTNRDVLRQLRRALTPEGRVAMDLNNVVARLRDFRPSRVAATRGEHDLLADRYHLDPLTSRLEVTRTVVRDGRARTLTFVVRLFAFPELRDWLLAEGFRDAEACGEDGGVLSTEHERMVVVANAG